MLFFLIFMIILLVLLVVYEDFIFVWFPVQRHVHIMYLQPTDYRSPANSQTVPHGLCSSKVKEVFMCIEIIFKQNVVQHIFHILLLLGKDCP